MKHYHNKITSFRPKKCRSIVSIMPDSPDSFHYTSLYESFYDGESSSESITIDSYHDDIDEEAPVPDPLASHWSSVLDAVNVPPFLCDGWLSHTLQATANQKNFFELLFSESYLHQIT